MSLLLIAAAIVFVLCASTLLLAHRNSPPAHPARAHALWSGVLTAALLIVLAVVAAPRWQFGPDVFLIRHQVNHRMCCILLHLRAISIF